MFPSESWHNMISDQEYNRMRWASRRGMLELDLVLEPFVSARYRDLDAGDRARFQRLLELRKLYDWWLANPHSTRNIASATVLPSAGGGAAAK